MRAIDQAILMMEQNDGKWTVLNTGSGEPAMIHGIILADLEFEQAVRAYRAFDHKTGVLKIHYQENVVSFFGKVWRRRQGRRRRLLRLVGYD